MRLIAGMTRRLGRCALVRGQDGFTMVIAMATLLIGSLLVVGAYAAVSGDQPVARKDQDRKAAYAAAEAGLNLYLFHLNQNNAYYNLCDTAAAPGNGDPNPVVKAWSGTGADTRTGHWRNLPGSSASYVVELLPANGASACVVNSDTSMIDASSGTFRIRADGQSRGIRRSIVATFKRRGFIDYLYSTNFEVIDPYAFSDQQTRNAAAACASWYPRPQGCGSFEIQFKTGDVVSGPLHTNDSILICGTPTFGRTAADSIEEQGASPGWWSAGCNGTAPNFLGTNKPGAGYLGLPTQNSSLASSASSSYTFTGTTTIVLNNATMTVTNAGLNSGTPTTMNFPTNGLVYVNNGSCATVYQTQQQYNDPAGCANVYVSGTYTKDLTIASARDIIAKGNILNGSDAVLGLIPANFMRVYHPVSFGQNGCGAETAGYLQNVEIDAAVLALTDSFIVDNYSCGNQMGTLTVKGAIAQKFRGPVGTGGGGGGTGYTKNYTYDDRFHFRNPPYFLDPIQSAWQVRRQTEQVPAR